jgi:hypothetical protein
MSLVLWAKHKVPSFMKGPQCTVFCVFLSVVAFSIFCHVLVWMLLETMCKELGSGLQIFRSSNFQKVECSNPQTLKGPHSLMLVLTMWVW